MKERYIIMSDDTPIEADVPELTKAQEAELEALIKNTIDNNK